jgi:hypothetical protein
MLDLAAIYIIKERKQFAGKISIRLAPAIACIILILVFNLLGYNYKKSKYDQIREQCISLGGTFNPGDPPTCTH